MKLILLEDVKNVGMQGDVVEVSEGYARNFLFPQHLAVEATDHALKEREEREKAAKRASKKEDKKARKLAAELDGREVVIKAKADGGKLFAAVTNKDIAKALKEQEVKVKADLITFEPKKETGTFQASVSLGTGYDATISVVIESNK